MWRFDRLREPRFDRKAEKATLISEPGHYLCRQRPTLPYTFACSTIGPAGLGAVGQQPIVKQMTTMEYPKNAGSAEEFLVCTALLPAVCKRYGNTFALLEIPEVLHSDVNVGEHGTIYFRRYDGETYNDRWSEQPGDHAGGCALGTELSSEIVQLLEDLRQIDVDWLLSLHPIGERAKASAFDLQGWLLSFREQQTQAVEMGITANEFIQAAEFIKGGFQFARRVVSNGDFYPRNLIKLPNKIVVVDWGYWTGYRVCFVDHLVNVAAFAFIHMWNNVPWQKEFVRHLREAFDIKSDDLRKATLIKSFEQAIFWRQSVPQSAQAQVRLFKMALKNEIFG